jgi:hypothetical protein
MHLVKENKTKKIVRILILDQQSFFLYKKIRTGLLTPTWMHLRKIQILTLLKMHVVVEDTLGNNSYIHFVTQSASILCLLKKLPD